MALIQIDNISKSYGEKQALRNVNLEMKEGRIFGLLGPNGAGKTTLIRIINRIILPTEGQVLFHGHPITGADVQKIGYLPEERGLYRKMKVGDQAVYFARLKGMSGNGAREELLRWFGKFGIESWWDKKVEELSKGMAQKVQFITTVVHNPALMILDEPFSGFDPVNAQLIREEILNLKKAGKTIILSTHNMESVEEMCDEIALIDKSRVVINGGVGEIRRRYGNNNMEVVYDGSGALPQSGLYTVLEDRDDNGRRTAVLALPSGADTNAALASIMAAGIRVSSFRELLPRMNDIFIKLVKEDSVQ